MSMTTPVIMDRDTMSFVIPSGRSADEAPCPSNTDITVTDVPKQIVAVREFTGLVTEKESAKQRAALEDALVRDNIDFDNLSFKTLQYNPPYTLPWVRRNEVLLVVTSTVARDVDEESVVESEGDMIEQKEQEVQVHPLMLMSPSPKRGKRVQKNLYCCLCLWFVYRYVANFRHSYWGPCAWSSCILYI